MTMNFPPPFPSITPFAISSLFSFASLFLKLCLLLLLEIFGCANGLGKRGYERESMMRRRFLLFRCRLRVVRRWGVSVRQLFETVQKSVLAKPPQQVRLRSHETQVHLPALQAAVLSTGHARRTHRSRPQFRQPQPLKAL